MNRFQKKCLIGSTLLHGLLIIILMIGSAFSSREEMPPVVTFLPPPDMTLTDGASRGGNAGGGAPPPPQQKPQPAPPAQAHVPKTKVSEPDPVPVKAKPEPEITKPQPVKAKPEAPKEIVREAKPAIKEPAKTPIKELDKPKIVFKPTKPIKPTENNALRDALQTAAKKAEQERRTRALREMANVFGSAKDNIRENTASSTSIEPLGFGGGGPAAMNYGQYVKSVYDDAWLDPDDVADENAVVKAEIIIAQDGTVIGQKIISRSGVPALDKSVQRALERVNNIRPFPAGSTDRQRTFILKFNLKAKRSLG